MLILTRRPNETIVINGQIFITVDHIKDDTIRLRITEPNRRIKISRDIGQTIRINQHIKLSLVRVVGIQVRIGITAPKDISIHREEVYQRIQAEKAQQAVATA